MASSGRPREIVNYIVESVLRPNLTDPNTYRSNQTNSQWIYSDLPDEGNRMPRIGAAIVGESPTQSRGLGSLDSIEEPRLLVQIIAKKGQSFDVDGDGADEKTEDVVEYFGEEIQKLIKANHTTILANTPADKVLYDGSRPENSPVSDFVYLNVYFELELVR